MALEVTILGCGSSAGTPVIGCDCDVCTSKNPKNKRTRASILIEQDGTKLLVDTSPDLREQALREQLTDINAIFVTHFHADHVMGIDDIRSFNYRRNSSLPIYSDAKTLENMKKSFSYVFDERIQTDVWYKPQATPHVASCEHYDYFTVNNSLEVQTFLQYHGIMPCAGVRVGGFAYSTDVNHLPEKSLEMLADLDVWVVDCLRYQSAPTHAHLEMTLGWIEQVKPKRAILTHMSHAFDYDQLSSETPEHVKVAFDGMRITI